ncbi:MAG: DNA mismatch repair protein MutS [Oscillospiraceae bacterium]|nr:DNA mismatch repair protein MutS [Oscillospiraceae bacterium]
MADLSPMMEQYLKIKEQHKDHILFFRLGDFYEMFFDDAILVSRELELTLTGRNCGLEERAPMCGVPFHSYESYVARLIAKGYKVAICEQMEDPALAKGLVTRDVIRVITPGTVIESCMLRDDRNNYIASIWLPKEGEGGICFADVSTGVIRTTVIPEADRQNVLLAELGRFWPSEVIFNPALLDCGAVTAYMKRQLGCSAEVLEEEIYGTQEVAAVMAAQFGQDLLRDAGVADCLPVQRAIAGLLAYLKDTQKHGMERLKTIENYSQNQYMQLSGVARANLELTETMRGREKKGTLLWVLDETATAMGKRLMRRTLEQPLIDVAEINRRLESVQNMAADNVARADIIEALRGVYDIERLMTRVIYGSATPKDMLSLAAAAAQLPGLRGVLAGFEGEELRALYASIDPLEDVRALIEAAIDPDAPATLKEGGVIRAGYNAEADELRALVKDSRSVLAAMEARLREETGIPKLRTGYNKVFGYYIEVTNSFLHMVPDTFIRKQTLTGGERFITEELKDLEHRILGANERLLTLEHELFARLQESVGAELARIQRTAAGVARLDVIASLAQVAVKNKYVRPTVDDSDVLHIVEGRHPVVEKMLTGSRFVPNDTLANCGDDRMLIITGPNMAGKSTYMRQTAILALMAQIGSFVPAKSCRVGVVDRIFTRVGASDDLSAGQSTFMVEMTEVAEILENATSRSLVILDEIGRGTSTFDGMSIARAVVEHIADKENGIGCKTLFATHYHELTALAEELDGVRNYNIAVKKRGDDITFLRRIVPGPADDSYGIEVAKLAGIPQPIINRAKKVLKALVAAAPDLTEANRQLDFTNYEKFQPAVADDDTVRKLRELDVDTLTPLEALNFLYQLKNNLK